MLSRLPWDESHLVKAPTERANGRLDVPSPTLNLHVQLPRRPTGRGRVHLERALLAHKAVADLGHPDIAHVKDVTGEG